MAYKRKTYRKTARYTKKPARKAKRRAAPRKQVLEIRILNGGGVQASTATLGKKSGRPVYARF